MIHIDFDPSTLEGKQKVWWDQWQDRADQAIRDLIDKWEQTGKLSSSDFDNDIWRDLKVWLLENVFDNKCAYCETDVGEARQPGDADHFRPKLGVNYRKQGSKKLTRAVTEDENGDLIEHPGYFWLVYHWMNLLPACIGCNRGSKKNQFPTAQRHMLNAHLTPERVAALRQPPYPTSKQNLYYLQPDDLDEIEEPLLLHPYKDDPRKHICFGHGGIATAIEDENGQESAKGAASIKVYGLNGPSLERARQKTQLAAFSKFHTAYAHYIENEHDAPDLARQKAWKKLLDITKGKTAHSAAACDYVCLCFPDIRTWSYG